MPSKDNQFFVSEILKHLVDIAMGRFFLTESDILKEKDASLQSILMGLLNLQEEIIFKDGQVAIATQLAQEREQKYRKVFDTSPVAILELTADDTPIMNLAQLFASIGKHVSVSTVNREALKLFGAETKKEFISHLCENACVKIAESKTMWEAEAVAKTTLGKLIHVLVRCTPPEPNVSTAVMVMSIVDLSELKRLENQFLQTQKMETIGRLAGGVAHDFNNLLTVINGYAYLLSVDETDTKRQEKIEAIIDAGDRAARLTMQLLAFSRQQIVTLSTLNINEIIVDMEKMFQRLIGEDVHLETRLSQTIGPIKADRSQIEQVVMNLVVNARDAMPRGGKIIIETANFEIGDSEVKEHLETIKGSFVMLSVSDNGMGMSKETSEKMFEPFFTTKAVGKGTGLGLSTVYGIVKQAGGNLWASSELGKGATFRIFFPRLLSASALGSLETQALEPIARGLETILLVEDESSVRKIAAEVLRGNGYTVLVAASGIEAIQLFNSASASIDLVLTDVVMPNMSGRELIENLQQTGAIVHSLYMSGYTTDAIVHHGVLDGMAFLHKPFSPRQLLQAVHGALDQTTHSKIHAPTSEKRDGS